LLTEVLATKNSSIEPPTKPGWRLNNRSAFRDKGLIYGASITAGHFFPPGEAQKSLTTKAKKAHEGKIKLGNIALCVPLCASLVVNILPSWFRFYATGCQFSLFSVWDHPYSIYLAFRSSRISWPPEAIQSAIPASQTRSNCPGAQLIASVTNWFPLSAKVAA
jgi:hypothetical protein